MTHVKNAEAFSRLVDFCTGYGGRYNPGRQTLQIDTLITQLDVTRQALDQVIKAKAQYDNEVNTRKQVFDQLPRLTSSILRTLEASGATPEKLEDARAFVRQITGFTTKKPVAPESVLPDKGTRSKLQLAYVSKADSFAKLVEAVSTEPLYQSNEAHLSVAGLMEKLAELNTLNREVSEARVVWSNARINRNNALYNQAQSVHKTVQAVRKYVRAIFGHDSEQYAQVKALSFTKPGKS